MSTEIKIKRGSGTTPALADGELGFNKTNKVLSIGTDGGNYDICRPIISMTQEEYNAATKNDKAIYIIESDDTVVTQSVMKEYAAPNGYGLGGGAKWINAEGTDLNNITDNGWYTFNTSNANRPFNTGVLFVANRHEDGKYCHQIAFLDANDTATSAIQVRRRTNGNWQAWRAWSPEDFAPVGHSHTKSQITDFPSSMPASDVYSWAKASNKPSYSASEVGATPQVQMAKDLSSKGWYCIGKLYPSSGTTASAIITIGGTYNNYCAESVTFIVDYTYYSANISVLNASFPTAAGGRQYSFIRVREVSHQVYIDVYYDLTVVNNAHAEVQVIDGLFDSYGFAASDGSGTLYCTQAIPHMDLGTEYRTTDHYLNKPVFKTSINFGYFSAGTHTKDHGIPNIDQIVSFEITNGAYGLYTSQFNAWISPTQFGFTSPWSAGAITIIVYYTQA